MLLLWQISLIDSTLKSLYDKSGYFNHYDFFHSYNYSDINFVRKSP